MRISFPNSAHLANIEGFFNRCTFANGKDAGPLRLEFLKPWISVHPAAIALTGCAGAVVRNAGRRVVVEFPAQRRAWLHYLHRMKLFDFLGVDPGLSITEHEPAGRFIPLTQIRTPAELSDFLVELAPLLHLEPAEMVPIQNVTSELVRNVLEHSDSSLGAFLCAQHYKDARKLAIGVADAGIGIRKAIMRSHPASSDLAAIQLALRPGITGTTKRIGGNEYNAGAGLFVTKSIACFGNTNMIVYSGDGFFKLRKTPKSKLPIRIQADPTRDFRTVREGLPRWHGTLVGIDIGLAEAAPRYAALLEAIWKVYNIDVRAKKAAKYRKPRFV